MKSKTLVIIICLFLPFFSFAQWEFAGPPSAIIPGVQDARMDTSNGKIFVVLAGNDSIGHIKYLDETAWVDTFPDFTQKYFIWDFAMINNLPYILCDNWDSLFLYSYNGTSWDIVGNHAIMDVNHYRTYILKKFGNILYVSGVDNDKAVVKRFDGSSWIDLGNTSMTDTWQAGSNLAYYNGMLYLSGRNNNVIKVKKYNGSIWQDVTPSYSVQTLHNYWIDLFVDTTTNQLIMNIDATSFHAYNGTTWTPHSTLTKCNNSNMDRQSSLFKFHNRLALVDYNLHWLSVFESGEWWTIPSSFLNSGNDSHCESVILNDSLFVLYRENNGDGYLLKKYQPTPIMIQDSIYDFIGCYEDTANYAVHVSGSPLALHWFQNNIIVNTGQCVDTLFCIALFNSAQNGSYHCVVTNGIDFDTTSSGNILVAIPPTETTQQNGIQVCNGETFQINSAISGTSPLNYQWYHVSTLIAGADSSTYLIATSSLSDQGNYHCVVSNLCGSTTTTNVPVTIYNLNLTTNDHSLICGGTTPINDVTNNYTGSGTLNYSWSPSAGLDNSTIQNPNVTIISDQDYIVTVTASTSSNCQDIDTVHITVIPLTINCSDLTLVCGDTLSFVSTTNYNGADPLIYTWSPSFGINDSTIENPSCQISGSGVYHVLITTSNNCHANDSLIVTSSTTDILSSICVVGVSTKNKNIIVWEKPITTVIDSFLVFRESSLQTGVYDQIGSLSYSDSTFFIDTTANSKIQSYKYKIANKDVCGFTTTLSDAHKTMHLNINQGMGNTWNLIWEEYEGFTVSSYKIYRGIRTDSLSLIGSTAGGNTSYSDFSAPSGFVYYQVEVISPNACNPSKNYNSSRSNIATNNPYGVNELNASNGKLQIFPNPANEKTTITWNNSMHQKYQVKITDISGKIILIKENITSDSFILNAAEYAPGTYFIEVSGSEILRGRVEIK